jgi:hypothetical protein
MHVEGWLIEADDTGIARVACPTCRGLYEHPDIEPSDSAAA